MKNKNLALIIVIIVLLISGYFTFISAAQPTQQYNKIYLSPFYSAASVQNVNYTYTVSVNPPDGISSVKSAILTFDAYINPTRTFYAWVNNKTCNNPTYVVSTSYSSAGKAQFYFDCSNVINQSGDYNITFRISGGAIGASTAWLDLTYMNNPKGDMGFMGTEYSPNDPATIFVQLRDSYGNSIQNGSCYLDVYSPNLTKTQMIFNAPMIEANGDDGLYYYDLVAPSELGVYMLSAKCSYSYNWQWIYREDDFVNYPAVQQQTGTWEGNSSLVNKLDGLSYFCDGTCVANFTYNLSTYGNITNITNINNYLYVSSDDAGDTITIAYLLSNNTWVNLANTLTTQDTASTIETYGYPQLLTNSIPTSAIVNGTVKLRFTTTDGEYFIDKFSIALLSSSGTIQELKGNSEMHITNIANQSSFNVWNYSNRSITEFNFDVVNESNLSLTFWNETNRTLTYYPDMTNYSKIAEDVWLYTTRNLTYFPTQLDLTNYTLISEVVWNYLNRTLTDYNQSDLTNYTKIVYDTWTYMNRSITEFPFDVVNEIEISDYVWNNSDRQLTNFTFDVVNETAVAEAVWTWNGIISNNILSQFAQYIWNWVGSISSTIGNFFSTGVWNYTARNLTYTEDVTNYTQIQNLISQYGNNDSTNYTLMQDLITQFGNNDVTNYTEFQNLITQYGNTDVANYTLIQYLVQQYGNDDNTNYSLMTDLITQYGNYDMVNYTLVQDLISQYGNNDNTNYSAIYSGVWMFSNRSLSEFNFIVNTTINLSEVSDYVWNNANRTLTFYNNSQQLDLTNYTAIIEGTWNYYNRTLTFYNNSQQLDLTNYSKIVYDTWSYYNRSLTDYNISDLTNYTAIFEGVWLFNNRSLTEFNFDLMQNLNITQIAEGVWYYSDRNLTYFPAPIINNLTASDVWNYVNRTLTYYELANLTASDIWNYTNRTLTYYLPGNNITAEEIWNFVNRNLTYYPDVVNYSKINQGVWSYSNRTLYFLYGNGTTGPQPSGTGKLPLSNIEISTPDPFYFDTDYIIYYDPIDIKGVTVEVSGISVKVLENITYTATTPVIMTDGRYKQTLTIPEQDISSFTLDVNMTQSYITTNQKSFITIGKKKAGITGFVTMDDTTKRNLVWILLILLFLLFMIIIIGVVSKNRKEKHKNRY